MALRGFRRALVVNDPPVAEPASHHVGERLTENGLCARLVYRHCEHVALDQLTRLDPLRGTPQPGHVLAPDVERVLSGGLELRCAHRLEDEDVVGLPAHHRRHRPAAALMGEHHVPYPQGLDRPQPVLAGVDQRAGGETGEPAGQHVDSRDGGPVHLGDVTEVRDTREPVRQHLRCGGVDFGLPHHPAAEDHLGREIKSAGTGKEGADLHGHRGGHDAACCCTHRRSLPTVATLMPRCLAMRSTSHPAVRSAAARWRRWSIFAASIVECFPASIARRWLAVAPPQTPYWLPEFNA